MAKLEGIKIKLSDSNGKIIDPDTISTAVISADKAVKLFKKEIERKEYHAKCVYSKPIEFKFGRVTISRADILKAANDAYEDAKKSVYLPTTAKAK